MTTTNQSSSKRLGLLVFFTFNLIIFSSLGIWQVQRLGWKTDLIERVNARVHARPQAAPGPQEWARLTPADSEYAPIQVQGQWLPEKNVLVYTNTELGPGYWVMAPLEVQAAAANQSTPSVVWVNQGFVPTELRQSFQQPSANQAQDAVVTGLLRWPEKENLFLRANVPEEDRWYRRWPGELSQARGLTAPTAPYFMDAFASPTSTAAAPTWPRGGMTQIQFSNNHLSYAITWFILALLNLAALVYVLCFDKKRSHGPRQK